MNTFGMGLMAAPKDVLGTLGLPSMSPTIGGHEGSGVVIEVGDGVSQFTPGDHVVTSFVAVCGKCRWCASGMEYICDVGAGTLAPGMPTDTRFGITRPMAESRTRLEDRRIRRTHCGVG